MVHAAAHVGDWGPAEKYRAINVVALEHMLHAAERHGRLERWIQISSLGVYPARHHFGTDETVPPDLTGLDGYTQTKAEAEIVINRHIREHGLPAVILRPGFIYGPGDRHALTRIVEKIEAGKMKFLGRGDRVLNNTSVENLCDAILLAIEKPDILGETFNIRDERLVTREEFINTVADYLGKPHPRHVPEWVGRTLVGPIEAIARLRGRTDAAAVDARADQVHDAESRLFDRQGEARCSATGRESISATASSPRWMTRRGKLRNGAADTASRDCRAISGEVVAYCRCSRFSCAFANSLRTSFACR